MTWVQPEELLARLAMAGVNAAILGKVVVVGSFGERCRMTYHAVAVLEPALLRAGLVDDDDRPLCNFYFLTADIRPKSEPYSRLWPVRSAVMKVSGLVAGSRCRVEDPPPFDDLSEVVHLLSKLPRNES